MQEEYPTFKACSDATGIPMATLQRARRQGCPALKDGKVALASFLRWWCSDGRPVSPEYERVRGEWVALKNARLALLVRQLKGELLSAEAVRRLGAELGHAIRKQVTQVHLLAPSLANQPTAVIEQRLREEEAGILDQLELLTNCQTWVERKPK